MLNKVQIYCKNQDTGCVEVLAYDQVESHENSCKQCLICKVRCNTCHELVQVQELSVHVCSSKNKAQQQQLEEAKLIENNDLMRLEADFR
jgi:hypothetical protein